MTSIPRSGKYGAVNGFSTVKNWTVSDTQDTKAYGASNTQSGKGRNNGVNSWAGSFDCYGGIPLVMPGQKFVFGGYTAPTTGVAGTTGTAYGGNAICDSMTLTYNWESGDIIQHSVAFSGDGPLGLSLATYTDVTAPDNPRVCGTKCYIVAVGGDEEWLNIKTATLTITAANVNVVNSSSACWTNKEAGPIDFTLALVEQNIARGSAVNMPQKGDDLILKLTTPYSGDDMFWLFTWCKLKEFSGINVNIETGVIVERTANLEMNGFNLGSVGSIIMPGAVQYWPAA